jgi:hypothetical protein
MFYHELKLEDNTYRPPTHFNIFLRENVINCAVKLGII